MRLFAQALRDTCREYDYVARMGGDEFVIVAPGLTPGDALAKADRISALAHAAGQSICGVDLLSASVGTAFFGQDGSDAEQLLAEADRRMYTAKQHHHEQDTSIAGFSDGSYTSVLQ